MSRSASVTLPPPVFASAAFEARSSVAPVSCWSSASFVLAVGLGDDDLELVVEPDVDLLAVGLVTSTS